MARVGSERAAKPALLAVLTVGALLRIALTGAMWPTFFGTGDVWQYVATADGDLFADPLHPAGYSAFLRALRPLSSSAFFPILVQHAMGIVGALLLYDAARRLQVGPWLALLPAGVVALSLDQVMLEHYLMTDAVFGFLLTAAAWAIVRASCATRVAPWLVGAGFALGAATLVRVVAGPLLALTVVLGCVVGRGSGRRRLGAAALVVAGSLLLLVPYELALHASKHRWNPTALGGWSAYVRVAPFADCSRFDPPEGTKHLCERSDPDDRPGPDYYAWTGGPARAAYPDLMLPEANDEMRRFAAAALRAQLDDYLHDTGRDLARYFVPVGPYRSVSGGIPMSRIGSRPPSPAVQALVESALDEYYEDTAPVPRPRLLDSLGSVQPFLRAGTPFLLLPLVAAVIGLVLLSGEPRRWVLLMMGWVVLVIGMSAATVGYVWRYAVPVLPIAALSFALVAGTLWRRRAVELSDRFSGARSPGP